MTERDRQTDFLKQLLVMTATTSDRALQARLEEAQHNERCVRYALTLVALIGGFAVCALGYSAVLHPEFFDSAMPTMVKLFCAVGLGSLICVVVFLACWLWYRGISNRVYEQCRGLVMEQLNERFKALPKPEFVHTLDFSLPVTPAEQERTSATG